MYEERVKGFSCLLSPNTFNQALPWHSSINALIIPGLEFTPTPGCHCQCAIVTLRQLFDGLPAVVVTGGVFRVSTECPWNRHLISPLSIKRWKRLFISYHRSIPSFRFSAAWNWGWFYWKYTQQYALMNSKKYILDSALAVPNVCFLD